MPSKYPVDSKAQSGEEMKTPQGSRLVRRYAFGPWRHFAEAVRFGLS